LQQFISSFAGAQQVDFSAEEVDLPAADAMYGDHAAGASVVFDAKELRGQVCGFDNGLILNCVSRDFRLSSAGVLVLTPELAGQMSNLERVNRGKCRDLLNEPVKFVRPVSESIAWGSEGDH
jgi:hypothetical protein